MPFKTLVIVLYISNELLIDALYIKLFFVPRQVVTTHTEKASPCSSSPLALGSPVSSTSIIA